MTCFQIVVNAVTSSFESPFVFCCAARVLIVLTMLSRRAMVGVRGPLRSVPSVDWPSSGDNGPGEMRPLLTVEEAAGGGGGSCEKKRAMKEYSAVALSIRTSIHDRRRPSTGSFYG